MSTTRDQLVHLLQARPKSSCLETLIAAAEQEHSADLKTSTEQLRGVWELRWSSSSQPWLKHVPCLENLQALDPVEGRGCNLLRLRSPLNSLGGISVQAELQIVGSRRVEVQFREGGWIGPSLPNGKQLSLMRKVHQSLPAWLDITVLDEQLRICRGNAGTTFALLKRNDLSMADVLQI